MNYIMKIIANTLVFLGLATRKPKPRHNADPNVWSVSGKYR